MLVNNNQQVVQRLNRQRAGQQPRHGGPIVGTAHLFHEDHVVRHRGQMRPRMRLLDMHGSERISRWAFRPARFGVAISSIVRVPRSEELAIFSRTL